MICGVLQSMDEHVVLNEQMSPRILLSKQFVDLLSCYSDCSLHKRSELQTVLRSYEGNSVFVAVKSLQGVTHVHDFAESSRPCKRLEATSDKGISHVGTIRIKTTFKNTFLILRLHLEHLAHQVDQIILLLLVILFEEGGFPGSQALSTVEKEHDSAGLFSRR